MKCPVPPERGRSAERHQRNASVAIYCYNIFVHLQAALALSVAGVPVLPFHLVPNPKPGKDPIKKPCFTGWQDQAPTDRPGFTDGLPNIPNGCPAWCWRRARAGPCWTLIRRSEKTASRDYPTGCAADQCRVDCQDDRLELVLLGHGKGEQVFVLAHSVIWWQIDADATWAELDDALKTIWHTRWADSYL